MHQITWFWPQKLDTHTLPPIGRFAPSGLVAPLPRICSQYIFCQKSEIIPLLLKTCLRHCAGSLSLRHPGSLQPPTAAPKHWRCFDSKHESTWSRSGMFTNLAMMGAGGSGLPSVWASMLGLRCGNLWALAISHLLTAFPHSQLDKHIFQCVKDILLLLFSYPIKEKVCIPIVNLQHRYFLILSLILNLKNEFLRNITFPEQMGDCLYTECPRKKVDTIELSAK